MLALHGRLHGKVRMNVNRLWNATGLCGWLWTLCRQLKVVRCRATVSRCTKLLCQVSINSFALYSCIWAVVNSDDTAASLEEEPTYMCTLVTALLQNPQCESLPEIHKATFCVYWHHHSLYLYKELVSYTVQACILVHSTSCMHNTLNATPSISFMEEREKVSST